MGPRSCAAAWLLSLAGAVTLAGCGTSSSDEPLAKSSEIRGQHVVAELPPGWSEIKGARTGTVQPSPLFTVTSSPLRLRKPLRVCHPPDALLAQLSDNDAMIEVDQFSELNGLPARPKRIVLGRKSYATYECSGPSHMIWFRDHARGLSAHVWFNPERVDPTVRRQAAEFLNSLQVRGFGSGECHGDYGLRHGRGFEGADGLSCGDAASLWSRWVVPRAPLTACPGDSRTHFVKVTNEIACQAAERFVNEDFAPHPGGWVERSSRFTCRIREFPARPGLRVDCLDTGRGASGPRFRFRFF